MENERFDALARGLGQAASRRTALKGLLSIGVVVMGAAQTASGADAARRGFSGPRLPTPDPCGCGPNQQCIGGICFSRCLACACGSCTLVPGQGSFCTEAVYATAGSCQGICASGYACDGGNICMKPCAL